MIADKIDKTVEAAELQRQQYLGLLEISKAIASQREIRGLFRELAERLRPFIDFQYLRVMVHDKTRNVMKMKIFEGSEPETGQFPVEQAVDGSISGWVWQNQQPFVTGDVQRETSFTTTKQLSDFSVKSLCVLPLTTARERLGVLIFASEKAWAYEQIDLEFALMVAGQIAVAVEAQFYQYKLARERDRLELLLDVNNILVSNLDLRELLSALSIGVRKVVSHDLAALALYDPAINMLRISALDFPANEDLFKEGEILPIEGEHGAGLAFKSRQVVIINKKENSTDSQVCNRFVSAGVKSCCIVPVVSHDRTLGIMSVGSLHENAFTESDAELLSQIAKQVAIAVENALAFSNIEALKNKLEEEKLYLEEEIRDERYFEEIIGNSSALRRVLHDVETVAPADSTVLIVGETGTGKELIARAIHNLSARHDRTLVKVNCAAIPTGLLESELFGHEKGAFTGATERRVGRFELAHQGTIFLDEVGDIPLELQPKLLRVLQEQEFERLGSSRTIRVDARVVAATNVNLSRLVEEKKFRSDLFYRLNVFPITLPALRDRP
ncbi:MAG: sigma 54-interacting transcriptional regulator, partial [Blastocatellia bacterium]|nr:sigma 54-interacting transcriptional regulator [Blastocatellia bacterium]